MLSPGRSERADLNLMDNLLAVGSQNSGNCLKIDPSLVCRSTRATTRRSGQKETQARLYRTVRFPTRVARRQTTARAVGGASV